MGEDSPLYTAYVRGRFPVSELNKLIKKEWIERVWVGKGYDEPQRKRIMGVDPGYERDPTAYVIRKGRNVETCDQWIGYDPTQSAKRVAERCDSMKSANKAIDYICVDSIGLGAGVLSCLLDWGFPALSVKASETLESSPSCVKRRDWLWWQARNFYHDHSPHYCEDTAEMRLLAEELGLPSYILKNGKIKVDGKDEIKKMGHRSPNLADAHNLTFAADWQVTPSVDSRNKVWTEDFGKSRRQSQGTKMWKCI